MTTEQEVSSAADPLILAGRALGAIESMPLERHPAVFTRIDELLRDALESPPPVSSG